MSFGADVVLFDDTTLVVDMITDRSRDGFPHKLPTDTCIGIAACANSLDVASRYVFRDDAHQTTRVHAS